MVTFTKLFQPLEIREMTLRNRIVAAPIGPTVSLTLDGYIVEKSKRYIEARAKGGAALIYAPACSIDPRGRLTDDHPRLDDDRFIAGLSELAQLIHEHGAKAAAQLFHPGREARAEIIHLQPVAPSAIPGRSGQLPKELMPSEIRGIVAQFAKAAERAKKARFDGIEIHGGHAYLVAQFLSSFSNKRQDAYGGELRNRARLLLEIIKVVKELVGQNYPVWCRINGREYGAKDGTTLEEAKEVARMAEDAGADAINVSARGYGAYNFVNTPESSGALVHLAQAIKKAVTIPVIAVGRIDAELGERILQEGKADLIAIGRGLNADPELPNKASSGRLDDIVPCIACFRCLDSLIFKGKGAKCTVNAATGREGEFEISPAEKIKKILVIGGGPAGMEAARVAALRGHEVVVYEKSQRLGGRLILAASPPGKSNITLLTNYLESQLKKLGVRIELGKAATIALVEEMKPDVVILATGRTLVIPQIPGLDGSNAVTAEDVLITKATVGEKVVIIGGNMVGCETADFLTEKGKKVTIIETRREMATDMIPVFREIFLDKLAAKSVTMLVDVKDEEVNAKGICLTTGDSKKLLVEADTIVLAAGVKPNTNLLEGLQGKVPEVYSVGDCVEPRRILEAIAEGSAVVRTI